MAVSSINKAIPSCIYHLVHLLSIRPYHLLGTRFSFFLLLSSPDSYQLFRHSATLISLISWFVSAVSAQRYYQLFPSIKEAFCQNTHSSTKMSFYYYYDVFRRFSSTIIRYMLLNNITTINGRVKIYKESQKTEN